MAMAKVLCAAAAAAVGAVDGEAPRAAPTPNAPRAERRAVETPPTPQAIQHRKSGRPDVEPRVVARMGLRPEARAILESAGRAGVGVGGGTAVVAKAGVALTPAAIPTAVAPVRGSPSAWRSVELAPPR